MEAICRLITEGKSIPWLFPLGSGKQHSDLFGKMINKLKTLYSLFLLTEILILQFISILEPEETFSWRLVYHLFLGGTISHCSIYDFDFNQVMLIFLTVC